MIATCKTSVAALALAALAALATLLAGCGQKGPLVLPTASPAPAASAPAVAR